MSTLTIKSISDSVRIDTINRFLQMSDDMNGKSFDCPFTFPNVDAVRHCKKVVITGPVGVGKTTILSEICIKPYSSDIKQEDDRSHPHIRSESVCMRLRCVLMLLRHWLRRLCCCSCEFVELCLGNGLA